MRRLELASASLITLASLAGCARESEPASKPAGEVDASPAPAAAASDDGLPMGPYADRDPALAKQLVEGGALLLDVRTPEEFAEGHVEGAINIDHTEVAGRLDEIRSLVGGDVHKPVVVYCKSGRRAGLVKQQLLDAGFDRVTNLGGLTDWPG